MFKTKINILFLVLALAISLGSCRKFLKQEYNDDPTSLEYPDPKVILPAAIANLAYCYGGDIARYDAMITQQASGGGNQWIAYQNYNFVDADFDNAWNSIFVTTLNSLYKTSEYCKENKHYRYEGAAKILSAFSYSILVDHWNDVPFKEALQAPDILQPKYDAGSAVYTALFAMLDEGEALMATTDDGRVPGEEDFLFGGDPDAWIAFSHAIKSRMYLHIKEYAKSMNELALADGIDAKMSFSTPSSGPMYQFNFNRAGDIVYMDSYIFDEMSGIGDSRIYNYIDTSTDELGPTYNNPAQPVFFVSAMEQKFIEAELLARNGDATASAVLEGAVAMSYDFVNGDTTGMAASIATYPYNDADPLADRLKAVMMQKYFAMFLQPEAFADYRRTGIPALTATSGPNVPRRYLYPTDEKNTNPNTPSGATLFTPKVFWDN